LPRSTSQRVWSVRQHTSAYVSIRQHTSAYVSIRQHTSSGSGAQPRQYVFFCTSKASKLRTLFAAGLERNGVSMCSFVPVKRVNCAPGAPPRRPCPAAASACVLLYQ
jgi:hypothetical protein